MPNGKQLFKAYLPMSQRDPELVRKACERMDKMREELRSHWNG